MGMLPGWLRLGPNEIANRARTLAYIRNGLALEPGLAAGTSADCDCDPAVDAPYVSPQVDDAPWYTAARPESAQFLGLSVDEIDLSGPWTRAVAPRGGVGCNGGGQAVGPLTLTGRTVTVSGLLVAATQKGMDYGVRWLSEALRGSSHKAANACGLDDLCIATACNGSDIIYRTLRKAGVIDGPLVAQIEGVPCEKLRRVSFTLASEIGYLFEDEALCLNAAPLVGGVPLCCRMATDVWIGDATSRLVIASGSPLAVNSIRVRTRPFRPEYALDLPGTNGNYASTPDKASLDVTGDLILLAKVSADDWTPTVQGRIINKRLAATQISYDFSVTSTGRPALSWSADGVTAITKQATVGTGFADGSTAWILAWLDVDNGAAGNDVRFFTSTDGVTWIQLGAIVTTAGVTSVFAGTAQLEVGELSALGRPWAGFVYYAEVRSGGTVSGGVLSSGTVVASPDFNQKPGTTTFTDKQGNVWTVNGAGSAFVGTNGCPGTLPVCSDFTITSMPPGTEMVIDGTTRTIQLERVSSREVIGGIDLVTVADGGPFDWIDLGACAEVCVCIEAAAPNANTTVTLAKVGRET